MSQPKTTTECSILTAYVDLIMESKHFLYIENQFFISWMKRIEPFSDVPTNTDQSDVNSTSSNTSSMLLDAHDGDEVCNPICDALYQRIIRAYREGKPYRVYIILPLLPSFQGNAGTPSGVSIHTILHYIRASLFKGSRALIPRLARIIPDPDEYITVYGLRKMEAWPDKELVTELIYVHCKMMIVDDRQIIIGSANVNDRSLLGDRDSELAVVVEETETVGKFKTSHFAGEKVKVGVTAQQLRKELMAEHLGILSQEERGRMTWNYDLLDDPVGSEFYNGVWRAIAASNSRLYDEVFSVIPSDNILSFEDTLTTRESTPLYLSSPVKAAERASLIRGHLVQYPYKFLDNEELSPKPNTKEALVPFYVWT